MARKTTNAVRSNRWVANPVLNRRFERTLRFLGESLPPPALVIDLGAQNPFSEIMVGQGYDVTNTSGDLDVIQASQLPSVSVDAVTAFEILEHLVAPFNVLRAIKAPRLFATVPLRLWFSTAYRNLDDPWDQHFHEFEDWQFDWLLQKAGWTIVRTEKWTSASWPIGVRPLLRHFTPRYYAVEAERR